MTTHTACDCVLKRLELTEAKLNIAVHSMSQCATAYDKFKDVEVMNAFIVAGLAMVKKPPIAALKPEVVEE